MNQQQPGQRPQQEGKVQQAPPKSLQFEDITDKPVEPQAGDNRRYIRITHKVSKHVIQFPTLMEPGPLKDMLDSWEASGKYTRGDLLVEQVDSPDVPQWMKICESKVVTKVDDVLIRGPFLAEPETTKQFMRDEAYKLLPRAYHDGRRGEKKDGKPSARAQEIEAAIDEKVKALCVTVATENEIKARRQQGALA